MQSSPVPFREWIVAFTGALVLASCTSSSSAPGGTGGSTAAPGTGGSDVSGSGGSGSGGSGSGGTGSGGSSGDSKGGTSGSTGGSSGGSTGGSSGSTGGSSGRSTGGSSGGRTGGSAGSTSGSGGGSVPTGGRTGGSASGGQGGLGSGGSSSPGTGGTTLHGTGGSIASTCRVGATTGAPGFGTPVQEGTGKSTDKYLGADVTRDGVSYRFITNWWGQGFQAADVSYTGTGFKVASATGTSTPDGTPIGYPTTYCGSYSERTAGGSCGLPAAFSTIDKLWTGWRWSSTDKGQYNAAWDIWLGSTTAFQSYLMVWLRDPPGRQPAGDSTINNVTVAGAPGTWIIRYGTVNNRPIVNYVRAEGQDACEFEFNVMDFINDAKGRSALNLPGDAVRAIAVGFEFWTGPFTNITSEDFYVKLVSK